MFLEFKFLEKKIWYDIRLHQYDLIHVNELQVHGWSIKPIYFIIFANLQKREGYTLFCESRNYKILIKYSDFDSGDVVRYFGEMNEFASTREDIPFEFKGRDIYYSVITCGMPLFYLSKSAMKKRTEEITYKVNLLNTALDVDSDGYLIFSDKMNYLDATERVYLMYYVGMFITKLICDKIFGFDYLVHLGIARKYMSIQINTNKQPDLIAFNVDDDGYSVFEAKGRTRIDNRMFNYAKNQVRSIKWISGSRPLNGIVSAVYPYNNRVKCHLKDPYIIEGKEFDISKLDLIWLYYEPIFTILREKRKNDEKEYKYEYTTEPKKNKYITSVIELEKNKSITISMNPKLYDFFDKFDFDIDRKDKKYELQRLKDILGTQKGLNIEISGN